MRPIDNIKSLDDLIRFYEAIPEEQWTTNRYVNDEGCRCAMAHLVPEYASSECSNEYVPTVVEAEKLIRDLTIQHSGFLINANDGIHLDYQQPTPKQRVLAYLNDRKHESTTV